jgi:hypothetical protein
MICLASARRGGRTELRPGASLLAFLTLVALLFIPEASSPAAAPARNLSPYGQLPLSFVANVGQTDSRASFVAHGRGYTLFVDPTGIVFVAQPRPEQDLASRLRAQRGARWPGLGEAQPAVVRAVARCRYSAASRARSKPASTTSSAAIQPRGARRARVRPSAVRGVLARRSALLRQRPTVQVRLHRCAGASGRASMAPWRMGGPGASCRQPG